MGTGGTCAWLDCYTWHGDTDCIHERCYCRKGFCALDGFCMPSTDCRRSTRAPCGEHECPPIMGETICVNGRCQCKGGACLTPATTCASECPQDTGGTCSWLNCDDSRGPTYCSKDAKCLCKGDGLCAVGGLCAAQGRPSMALSGEDGGPGRAFSPLAAAEVGAAAAAAAALLAACAVCRRRRHVGAPLLS
eukprot:NODE_3932_length_727_cov_349.791667.p1 GENE.NODE_3932_length_727_cov_349.791667~~NODE_3932_length_727_cov_349.791667.p1  ORF type:complete len:191 (+),score=24.39 NODE_3932_length_727_cov_349.791667:3-575(+)